MALPQDARALMPSRQDETPATNGSCNKAFGCNQTLMSVRCILRADCQRSSTRLPPAISHGFAADLSQSGISIASSDEAQTTIPTHGLGGKTPRSAKPPYPFMCCANADTLPCSCLTVGCACFHSRTRDRKRSGYGWPGFVGPRRCNTCSITGTCSIYAPGSAKSSTVDDNWRRPSVLPSFSWLMASIFRRRRTRFPTCKPVLDPSLVPFPFRMATGVCARVAQERAR